MENKKKIIDGVDVSGCELYRDDNGVFAPDGTAERTELCYLTNDYCGNRLNCYYKQLKRKEQECDVLRKLAETHLAETINMQRELDQLTEELAISIQENEEGREINAELKAQLLDQEAETLKAGGIIHALKQALIEIKQLLEDALDTDKTNAEQSFDNFYKAIELCEVLDER